MRDLLVGFMAFIGFVICVLAGWTVGSIIVEQIKFWRDDSND